MAAERGHCKIMEHLVAEGLDIDIKNGGDVSVCDSTLYNDSRIAGMSLI